MKPKYASMNNSFIHKLITGFGVLFIYLNIYAQEAGLAIRNTIKNIPVSAQVSFLDGEVQKFALKYLHDSGVTGVSIGIYNNGKKYLYNYGEIEKGKGILPSGDTYFSLGSLSKIIIGTLLTKAVSDGKLSMQDDIRKYLKGHYPNLSFNGEPIRIMYLANYTDGLPIIPEKRPSNLSSMTPSEQFNWKYEYSRQKLLRTLHKITLQAQPGMQYSYYSCGYALLSIILENVYDKKLNDLIEDYFGKSFHMSSTKSRLNDPEMRRFAKGYHLDDEALPYMNKSFPAMASTTNDMLNYIQTGLTAGKEGISFLQNSGVHSYNYGLPFDMISMKDTNHWSWYTGYTYGFISLCAISPAKKSGIIIWANNDTDQERMIELAIEIEKVLE